MTPATPETVQDTLREIDSLLKKRRVLNGPRTPQQSARKKARKAQKMARRRNR